MEDFLEEIFGDESILSRGNFIKSVSIKTPWVFESEDIRRRWHDLCENNPAIRKKKEEFEAMRDYV